MRIVWTDPAEEDREQIVLFIAQENEQAALEMDDLFTAAADSLATFPTRAKVGRVSVRTLHDWEQGRREPSGAARTLLKIAARHPEVVREVMQVNF